MSKSCTTFACIRPHYAKKLCHYHYNLLPERIAYAKQYSSSGKQRESCRKYGKSIHAKHIKYQYATSAEGKFSHGKAQAKFRKISWELDFETYCTLTTNPCYYCDAITVHTGVGLDRIDNKTGYTVDNVLPCCGTCNYIRGDDLTVEETKVAIKAIIDYRKRATNG